MWVIYVLTYLNDRDNIHTTTIDPLPPPMNLRLAHVREDYLSFTWSDAVTLPCQALYYNISAVNCGTCPATTDTTYIECTGLGVTTERRVCTLAVQTIVCNNLTGMWSNEVNAILQGKYTYCLCTSFTGSQQIVPLALLSALHIFLDTNIG